MATVNRYYTNTPYEYVSLYTPIPFEQLYNVGKEYNARRDKAEEKLTTYLLKMGEFQSLISKDVDNYYKTALNDNIKSIINEAASNPDILKSAEWQSRLQQGINSVDYATLAKLKKSAAWADQYQAKVLDLQSRGLAGPEGWLPDVLNTHDTTRDGIFKETPLMYKSVVDVVKPYVDDILESYLYTKGGYDWYGRSFDTVKAQVDANKSDILMNPQIQRHAALAYLSFYNQTFDRAKAQQLTDDYMLRQLDLAAGEFAYENRKANEFSLAATKKSGNGDDPVGPVIPFTLEAETTGETAYKNGLNIISSNFDANKSADKSKYTSIQTPRQAFDYMFREARREGGGGRTITTRKATEVANNIVNLISYNMSSSFNNYLQSGGVPGISKKPQSTELGNYYTVTQPEKMIPLQKFFISAAGWEYTNKDTETVINKISRGDIGDMVIVGGGLTFTLPVSGSTQTYTTVEAAITEQQAKELGLSESSLLNAGFSPQIGTSKLTSGISVTSTDRSDEDITVSQTNSDRSRKTNKYYKITFVNRIPSTVSGNESSALNSQMYNLQYMTQSQAGKELPNTQGLAFGYE